MTDGQSRIEPLTDLEVEVVPGLTIPIPPSPNTQDTCRIAQWSYGRAPSGTQILHASVDADPSGASAWVLRWGMDGGPDGIVFYSEYVTSPDSDLIVWDWPANQYIADSLPAFSLALDLERDARFLDEIVTSEAPSALVVFSIEGFDPFDHGDRPALGPGSPAQLYSIQPAYLRELIAMYPHWFEDS